MTNSTHFGALQSVEAMS